VFLLHSNSPRSFVVEGIQRLDESLRQSILLLIKCFAQLLQLIDRIKLHRYLILWLEYILKHLRESPPFIKLIQLLLKIELLFLFFIIPGLLCFLLLSHQRLFGMFTIFRIKIPSPRCCPIFRKFALIFLSELAGPVKK
jgi:hypothetical protein